MNSIPTYNKYKDYILINSVTIITTCLAIHKFHVAQHLSVSGLFW